MQRFREKYNILEHLFGIENMERENITSDIDKIYPHGHFCEIIKIVLRAKTSEKLKKVKKDLMAVFKKHGASVEKTYIPPTEEFKIHMETEE